MLALFYSFFYCAEPDADFLALGYYVNELYCFGKGNRQ